jgi:uncharacterized protein (TIGR02301 family)
MLKRCVIALIVFASLPVAAEEDYAARRTALTGLSRVLGELHHIRRMCEPDREADIWRERMKRLVDLELPAFDLREEMVGAFNDGYVSAQTRFPYCDRDAEDYAAARAVEGETIVASLTAPLFAAERGDDAEGVTVFRGVDPQ